MAIDSAVNALLTNKLAEATKKLEIVQAEIADGLVDTGGFVCLVLRGRHEFSYWCSTSDRFDDAKVQQTAWQRFKEEQQCAEAAEAAEDEAGDPAILSAAVVGAGLSDRSATATLPSFLTNTDRVARDWRAYLEALADVHPHESSAETPLWYTALFPEAAPHMPPTRPAPPVPVALAARQKRAWERLGGREIEDMVGRGAVALLDAHWVLAHASRGGRLTRRQEMPPEAFITLAELRAAGCPEGTLPVLACTHAWQGADEPDADGSQQRLLVNFLKAATALTPECVGNPLAASLGPAGTQRWGVFIPFSSMHQRARPDEEHAAEDALFHEALMSVDRWYVHAHTLVLRLAHLGAHYGASMTPPGSNLARYAKVGGAVVGHLAFGADTSDLLYLDLTRLRGTERTLEQIELACRPLALDAPLFGGRAARPAAVAAARAAAVSPTAPPLYVYASFSHEHVPRPTTGVAPRLALELAERFRLGVASRLRARGIKAEPKLVHEASELSADALVLFAGALGTESGDLFGSARACATHPRLWEWVRQKHAYVPSPLAPALMTFDGL